MLIVEDNDDAAELLALVVTNLGHEVRIARCASKKLLDTTLSG